MSTVSDQKSSVPRRSAPAVMNVPPNDKPSQSVPPTKSTLYWCIAAVAVLSGTGWLFLHGADSWSKTDVAFVTYDARRGNLPITIKERGNLESQDNEKILCEVDDIRGDGIDGTPIIWLVPNGSSVKEGDLLVQLESASHLERLDEQILDTEQQRAKMIQSKSKYHNQESENRKTEADARLKLKIAKLELEMFQDEENGTAHLELEEIRGSIDDINNQILEAQASLKLKAHEKRGTESLFKMGYAGKSELDRSRLEFLQAESTYAAMLNSLKTTLSSLKKKEVYEHEKEQLRLKGDVDTAERDLEQTIIANQAELEQAEAAMIADERAFEKEKELEDRYREQLAKCKIFAPQDGMVAYATPHRWQGPIAVGSNVHERQHIMSLPNLQRMQVKTSVHESVLEQVKVGLPATIRLDAYNDVSYSGTVKSVAVLPDQEGWYGSDTKVYETIVTIDEEVDKIKPGMTAVVEIHVEQLPDVISIPVQAIVQRQKRSWAYVQTNGTLEKRELTLGKTNSKFVEVKTGIDPADQVVLNPMAILDESEGSALNDSADSKEATPPDNESKDQSGSTVSPPPERSNEPTTQPS